MELPPSVCLEPHPTARDKAVAACYVSSGSTIVSAPSIATVLLPSAKGHRCDHCFRYGSTNLQLRKCTGCASYWYCGVQCQNSHWPAHKNLCKFVDRYCTSPDFTKLAEHEKLEAMLLTHLVAQISSNISTSTPSTLLSTFLNLSPGPLPNGSRPVACSATVKRTRLSSEDLDAAYSRFGNNNFAIHSHLTTYAHGIFPLASRLFNHSCVPNAVPKYVLSPSEPVRMEIVAIRDIVPGEEICIPYLDPALLQSRQQIFELTYGFTCSCPSCSFLRRVSQIPPAPGFDFRAASLEKALRTFVFPLQEYGISGLHLSTKPFEDIPSILFPTLHESYLTRLSEEFSKTSHDGSYDIALDVGLTLLALYCLIYPPNYPQIGMHLLEMAKTAWNAVILADNDSASVVCTDNDLSEQARIYLGLGRGILDTYGPEGDPGGPLEEIRLLQELLDGS